MPVSARKQLFDIPDELAAKITIVYYSDAKDALLKALSEQGRAGWDATRRLADRRGV